MAVPAPQATNRNDRIDKSYLGRSVRALRDQAMSSLLWVIAVTVATVPATAAVTVTQTAKKAIALPLDRKRSSRPSKDQACMSLVCHLAQIISGAVACMRQTRRKGAVFYTISLKVCYNNNESLRTFA